MTQIATGYDGVAYRIEFDKENFTCALFEDEYQVTFLSYECAEELNMAVCRAEASNRSIERHILQHGSSPRKPLSKWKSYP